MKPQSETFLSPPSNFATDISTHDNETDVISRAISRHYDAVTGNCYVLAILYYVR